MASSVDEADVRRELYNTSRIAGAPSLPASSADAHNRRGRRRKRDSPDGHRHHSPLRSSAKFATAGVPVATTGRSRTRSKGRKVPGGTSRFPLLPTWAQQAGASHLLGQSPHGGRPQGTTTGPRIVQPNAPEVAERQGPGGNDNAHVTPGFYREASAGAGGGTDPIAALALGGNPYAALQAVSRQHKTLDGVADDGGSVGEGGYGDGEGGYSSPSRGRSASPSNDNNAALLASLMSHGNRTSSAGTGRFPTVSSASGSLQLMQSGNHPLAQRLVSPRDHGMRVSRSAASGASHPRRGARSRARGRRSRSPASATPLSPPARGATPPTLPGDTRRMSDLTMFTEGASTAYPVGTARFEVDRSAAAARLHRGDMHEQLKAVMKQERAAKKRVAQQVHTWKASREHVAVVSQQLQSAQVSIAQDMKRQVRATIRQHDVIRDAPQRSGDAQRLLRMRIERNFSKMVKRWMEAKLGWALHNWHRYVRLHRKYMEWADRVTPHARVIQRIYRTWRSRMIIRAARAARIQEARRVASLGLQAAFRGHRGREVARRARERRLRRLRHEGACTFQRVVRGFLARKLCDRVSRVTLRAQLKRMGLGTLALLYDVLEYKRWPDDHLEVLEIALDIVREAGGKGRGGYTFLQIVDVSKKLAQMEDMREAMKRAARQAAERERTERVLMLAEERWQRSNERNMAAALVAKEMREAAEAAVAAREAAEQAAIEERKVAVVRREEEKKKKMRRDADKELKRRAMLREKERKAEVAAQMEARLREDRERKRQAKLRAAEEKRRNKLDAAQRKRTLAQLKKIKAVKKQQEMWQREKDRKARAAAKKKAQAAKLRAEKERKAEKQRMREAMKAKARLLEAKKQAKAKAPAVLY